MKVINGIIKVRTYLVLYRTNKCVLLDILLKSKYAEIDSVGGGNGVDSIFLTANENTLYADKRYKRPTELVFNDFKGFNIFSHHVSKYNLSVVLYKF